LLKLWVSLFRIYFFDGLVMFAIVVHLIYTVYVMWYYIKVSVTAAQPMSSHG
jgi:hypothetical protein